MPLKGKRYQRGLVAAQKTAWPRRHGALSNSEDDMSNARAAQNAYALQRARLRDVQTRRVREPMRSVGEEPSGRLALGCAS